MAATIHDLRSITPRTNGTRNQSDIEKIARHHSATTSGDWHIFWPYWRDIKGWGTGGYHEIILRDGSVQLCYDPEEITNGVGKHNGYVYHITLVGNGSFTAAQERTWEERSLYNMKRFGLSVSDIKGHKEFKGASTSCPGVDMGMVRNRLHYLLDNKPPVKEEIKMSVDTSKGIGLAKVTANKLNLRKDPVISAPFVKELQEGEEYYVYGVRGIWYDLGGGWASSGSKGDLLDFTPHPTKTSKPSKPVETVTLIGIKSGKVIDLTGKDNVETADNATKFLK